MTSTTRLSSAAGNRPKSSLDAWDSNLDLEATQRQVDDLLARQELDDLLYAGAASEVMTTISLQPPSVALRAWESDWDPEAAQQEVERLMGLPSPGANPNETLVFARIPASVMTAKLLPNAKLVYGVLASEHRGGEGVGPTREQLSDETALNLSQVKTTLDALRQHVLIQARQPRVRRPNHYILSDWKNKQKERFTRVPKWLAKRSEVSAGAKLLYGVISNGVGYAIKHHEPYSAGEKKLAEKMAVEPRTVRRYLGELEAWGLIRVERTRGEAGEHLVNRYSLRRHRWMASAKLYDRPEGTKGPLPEDIRGPLLEDAEGSLREVREGPLPEDPKGPLRTTPSKTSSSEHRAAGAEEDVLAGERTVGDTRPSPSPSMNGDSPYVPGGDPSLPPKLTPSAGAVVKRLAEFYRSLPQIRVVSRIVSPKAYLKKLLANGDLEDAFTLTDADLDLAFEFLAAVSEAMTTVPNANGKVAAPAGIKAPRPNVLPGFVLAAKAWDEARMRDRRFEIDAPWLSHMLLVELPMYLPDMEPPPADKIAETIAEAPQAFCNVVNPNIAPLGRV